MKFQRIIEALYRQPLDITTAGFEAIDAIVRPHLVGKNPGELRAGQFVPGKTDLFGEPLPEMLEDLGNGVALIHITGPLIQHASLIEKSCGACSYQDIVLCLDQAMRNGNIENVILDISSPGGECCGLPEAADRIARAALMDEKGIFAYTETQMCSAAYYLAAGANGIYATKSAYIGCIGTMMAWIDLSKAYEMAGMKPVVFTSGKYKGAGIDGTSLTADQAQMYQDRIDELADMFKSHVADNRQVEPEMMEGQTVLGEEAAESNLVDDLVPDLDDLIGSLR